MNIVLISNYTGFMKEATNITTYEFAKELVINGHNVFIVSSSGDEKKEYVKDEINVIQTGFKCKKSVFNPKWIYKELFSIRKVIRKINNEHKIDIIHNFSAAPVYILRALIAKMGLKDVKLVHTMKSYSSEKLGKKFFGLLNKANIITVPTNEMKKTIYEKGIKTDKIKMIRSHINLKKFIPLDKDKTKIKYGYQEKKIILNYGSFRKEKGVKDLIRAMPEIIQSNPSALLILVPRSEKWYDKTYDTLISEVSMKKYVKIITHDIDVVEYLNFSDILVLPYSTFSFTEANPSCMIEAMACKTPVVVSNFLDIKEIVTDNQEVLFSEPKSHESIAKKVDIILNNPKVAKTLTENSYKKRTDFDIKKITEKFIEIYNSLTT